MINFLRTGIAKAGRADWDKFIDTLDYWEVDHSLERLPEKEEMQPQSDLFRMPDQKHQDQQLMRSFTSNMDSIFQQEPNALTLKPGVLTAWKKTERMTVSTLFHKGEKIDFSLPIRNEGRLSGQLDGSNHLHGVGRKISGPVLDCTIEEGMFKDNQLHGYGRQISSSGIVSEGIWSKGKCLAISP